MFSRSSILVMEAFRTPLCCVEHPWPDEKLWSWFSGNPSKSQLLLFKTLTDLFEKEEVLLNYPLSSEGLDSLLGIHTCTFVLKMIDLDVYIPRLKLAFEYHGEQHYFAHHMYGSSESRKEKDSKKRELCGQVCSLDIPLK